MTLINDLLTWEDHALTHIDSVWDAESAQVTTVEDIREYIDSLIETYFVGNEDLVDPEVWFQLADRLSKRWPTGLVEPKKINAAVPKLHKSN